MTITQARRMSLSDLVIEGNNGAVERENLAWLEPLPATASDDELRHGLETKGVVHIKGVMPRDYVLDHRERYFNTVAPTGILREGTTPRQGIWAGGDKDPKDFVGPDNANYLDANPNAAEHVRLVLEAASSEWGDQFCGNDYIKGMVSRLRPEWTSPFVFRRQIWRTNIPSAKGSATGVHYDHIFLRGGPPTALTAWVPVGDCRPTQGGLMYLEDSVSLGHEIEDEFTRLGRETGLAEDEARSAFNPNMGRNGMLSLDPGDFARTRGQGRRWLIGDYEAGDVVFHNALMIHASGGNVDPDGNIRLSTDLRYADKYHGHDARWNQGPHRIDDGL